MRPNHATNPAVLARPSPLRALLFHAANPGSLEAWRWQRLQERSAVHGIEWFVPAGGPAETLGVLESVGWQHNPWVERSIAQAQAHQRQRPVDLVVSSGPPLQAHLAARSFARSNHLPWLLDWVKPTHPTGWRGRVSAGIALKLERGLVLEADALMTSSQALAEQVRLWHQASRPSRASETVTVLPLGHDHLPSKRGSVPNRPLRMVCTQTVDVADVACLLEALGQRQEFLQGFELVLAAASPALAALAKRFGSGHRVQFLGGISAAASEVLERESDVILSFGQAGLEVPLGLGASVMRQRPVLHVLGGLHDPSLELLSFAPAYLACDNNRFGVANALEAVLRGAWVYPEDQVIEDWSWLGLGASLASLVKSCAQRLPQGAA